jgi:hypothetical protein
MLPHFARFARTFKGSLVGTADHFALQKRQPFLRRYHTCSCHNNYTPQGSNHKLRNQKEKRTTRVRFSFWLV